MCSRNRCIVRHAKNETNAILKPTELYAGTADEIVHELSINLSVRNDRDATTQSNTAPIRDSTQSNKYSSPPHKVYLVPYSMDLNQQFIRRVILTIETEIDYNRIVK